MIDKNFNLIEYLKYKGFEIKRESDKRDILVLRHYFDSWAQESKEISVIVHYHYGCNTFMLNAGLMMEVYMYKPGSESHEVLFKGLQPLNFDNAETLFEMVLPSRELLEKIDAQLLDTNPVFYSE